MIGNDIIDLRAVRERSPQHWQRYRAKTMTTAEQELLAQYRANNLDIWLAWAVKESVYKLEFPMEQERYFAPKQIQILAFDPKNQQGSAQGKFAIYPFEIHFGESFLHALTWSANTPKPDFEPIIIAHHSLSDHLSNALYKKFAGQLLRYERLPFPHFIMEKERIIPVSMSHHGRWGAFAF